MIHIGYLLDLLFRQSAHLQIAVIRQLVDTLHDILAIRILITHHLRLHTLVFEIPVSEAFLTCLLVKPGIKGHPHEVGHLPILFSQSAEILPELVLTFVGHAFLYGRICRSPGICCERTRIAACTGIYQTGLWYE